MEVAHFLGYSVQSIFHQEKLNIYCILWSMQIPLSRETPRLCFPVLLTRNNLESKISGKEFEFIECEKLISKTSFLYRLRKTDQISKFQSMTKLVTGDVTGGYA